MKGSYEKNAYKKLFGGAQLPYEDAHSTLLTLLKQQETEQHGGLEAATNAAYSKMNNKANQPAATRAQYLFGLAAVLAFVVLASVGMPYAPPPLY